MKSIETILLKNVFKSVENYQIYDLNLNIEKF